MTEMKLSVTELNNYIRLHLTKTDDFRKNNRILRDDYSNKLNIFQLLDKSAKIKQVDLSTLFKKKKNATKQKGRARKV